jgi:hypothetical protein
MDTKINIGKIGLGAGIFTAGGLMLYFIMMKYLNLVELFHLRYFNFFILGAGILLAMNKYKNSNDNHVEYLEGFFLGMFTTAVASTLFAVFVGIYLGFHPDFMNYIMSVALMGDYLTPSASALIVAMEGGISGLLITFASLQYYRRFETWHAGHA